MKKSFIVIIVTLFLAGLIGYGLYSYAKSQGVEFGDSSSYSTPVKSNSEKNYIANRNSGKLHSKYCDSLPYEQNRIYFSSIEEANKAGYTNNHKECMGGY